MEFPNGFYPHKNEKKKRNFIPGGSTIEFQLQLEKLEIFSKSHHDWKVLIIRNFNRNRRWP